MPARSTRRAGLADGRMGDTIRDAYAATDEQIGCILESLPPEAMVVVVSLYGMKGIYPTDGLAEAFCRQLGYQVGMDSPAASANPVDLARRIVPAGWREAISKRLPSGWQDRLLARNLAGGIDWSRTRAFAIPALYDSLIRVNLRGRDPRGIVEPRGEYDSLLNDIEANLWQLVDPVTGQPAVEAVYRTQDVYGPDRSEVLPDLFVHWRGGQHFMDAVEHPKGRITQSRPHYFRSSGHSVRGLAAAAGPDLDALGDLSRLAITDWPSLFLSLLETR